VFVSALIQSLSYFELRIAHSFIDQRCEHEDFDKCVCYIALAPALHGDFVLFCFVLNCFVSCLLRWFTTSAVMICVCYIGSQLLRS
jgi:hypothetical protein